jgi:hypothetical protein
MRASSAGTAQAARMLQAGVGNQAVLRARESVPRIAGDGVADASEPLPHLAQIQAAFGRHDVSRVRAAIGGRAGHAAARLGALAYATGNRVAFRSAPDPRLAAHEAAHVVQQRAGLALPGGVGRPGDPHERLADAVADAVVAGRSVEALLDGAAGPPRPGVQLHCECGGTCDRCARYGEAAVQLQVAQGGSRASEPAVEASALRSMLFASTVLSHTPGLGAADRALLARIIAAVPIYEVILERNRVRRDTEWLRQGLADLEHRPVTSGDQADRGVSLPGGVAVRPGELDALRPQITAGEASSTAMTEDIRRAIGAAHFADEAEVIRLVKVDFPAMWVRRARQIALARLDVSRDQVLAEQRRYPAGGGGEIGELRAADAELARLAAARAVAHRSTEDVDRELIALREQRARMERLRQDAAIERLPGGVPASEVELRQVDAQIAAVEARTATTAKQRARTAEALEAGRVRLGGQHPLLHTPAYYPGMFVHRNDSEIAGQTQRWTQDILDNIQRTRENIADGTIKVWDLNDIPEQTYNDLGVPGESTLGTAVRGYVAGQRSDAYWLGIAQAVLEVVLVIGVTILNPVAGAELAVVLTAGHLAADAAAVTREEAAAHTHVLPELADISAKDPDYLAVVIDIASLGLDVFQFRLAVRALRPAAAALRAGTMTAEAFESSARRAVGDVAAEALTERTVRRLSLRGAAERLTAARAWAARVIGASGATLLELGELAIERLRTLPKRVLDWLAGLPDRVLRAVLGCASPCRVDLEEIIRLFREAEAAGVARGPTLATVEEIVAALPAGLERSRIAIKLADHPGYLAAIRESGMTARDLALIEAFLTPADAASLKSSYETFAKFLNRAVAVRIGPDPERLVTVLKAMKEIEARSASASSRGAIFEAWTRMNVPFAGEYAGLAVTVAGQRVRADRWVATLGEIWDMKAYFGIEAKDLIDFEQARLYALLIGREVDGHTVRSINYLFLTQEVAAANQRQLVRRGLTFRLWYLGPGNVPVQLP